MIAFSLGALYFGYKAHYLKEKWIPYAIAGGIGTWVLTWVFSFFLSLVFIGFAEAGIIVAILIAILTMAASIYLIDKWSGLYWNAEKYAAKKKKEEETQEELSVDEMAEIRAMQIEKGEGTSIDTKDE